MWLYVVRRTLAAVPTALVVLTAVFLAIRLLPGDPAMAALGEFATAAQLETYRARMGLDRPLHEQYLAFLGGLARGDFGRSLNNNAPINALIAHHLPYTIHLAIAATIISVLIGIPAGVISAVRRNTATDYTARVFALSGLSVPDFYLGAMLLIVFGLHLRWFPMMGGGGGSLPTLLYHLFLPAFTLGLVQAAFVMRLARSAMLEVMSKDYVRTARSKGVSSRRVLYRHALRNALIPVATGVAIGILSIMSGSITVELVFNRPGVGRLLIGAVGSRDYTVIQAGLVVFSLFVVVINLATDLIYGLIDPRIQYG